MADFTTCDRVICTKSHSQASVNGVKKGRIFKLLDFQKLCSCTSGMLDIGVNVPEDLAGIGWACGVCNKSYTGNPKIWWFDSRIFAPIQDEEIGNLTVEEILEEELEEVL